MATTVPARIAFQLAAECASSNVVVPVSVIIVPASLIRIVLLNTPWNFKFRSRRKSPGTEPGFPWQKRASLFLVLLAALVRLVLLTLLTAALLLLARLLILALLLLTGLLILATLLLAALILLPALVRIVHKNTSQFGLN